MSDFWFRRGWKLRWEAEVARRAAGLKMEFDSDYFFHTNPLYEPSKAMIFRAGRYMALLDEMARLKQRRVLEIGCAHGLATWLMKDFAEEVVGSISRPIALPLGVKSSPKSNWSPTIT